MPHRRGSADQDGCCRRQIGLKRLGGDLHRFQVDRTSWRRALLAECPITEQAIATPGRRPQEFTIRAERLANCRYVKLKCIVLDNRARPYATREIVLGDELAGRANQNFDDVERATADRDGSSTGPQFTASKIDLPLTRLVHQSSALRRHIAAPSAERGSPCETGGAICSAWARVLH